MIRRHLVFFAAATVFGALAGLGLGISVAQELKLPSPGGTTSQDAPAEPKPAGLASVDLEKPGEPGLSVVFNWKTLAKPSLQLRLLDEAADPKTAKPLAIDYTAAIEVWANQVSRLNRPMFSGSSELVRSNTAFLELAEDARLLTVRGQINSLNKPAAFGYEEKDCSSIVFFQVADWLNPAGTFRLAWSDLTALVKWKNAGQVRVWILDADKVVETATVAWPGQPDAKPDVELTNKPEPEERKPEDKKPADTTKPGALRSSPPSASSATPEPAKPTPAADKPEPTVSPKPTPSPKPEEKAAESKPEKKPEPEPKPAPPPSPDDMTIDQLTQFIETRWGKLMGEEVRKAWNGGMANYYRIPNPDSVRREIFMNFLKNCYQEQPPGDLRDAFAILFRKLRQASQ